MPQLDIMTFCSQCFWLLIGFFGLYFYLLNSIIPKIAQNVKFRQKRLHSFSQIFIKKENFNSQNSVLLTQSLCLLAKNVFSQTVSFYSKWFEYEIKKYKNTIFVTVNKMYLISYQNSFLKSKFESNNLNIQ